MANNTFQGRMI
jgi:hypothetical protein